MRDIHIVYTYVHTLIKVENRLKLVSNIQNTIYEEMKEIPRICY